MFFADSGHLEKEGTLPQLTRSTVVQFGTSRFLQAHADLFIDEAAKADQPKLTITVVAGSGQAAGRERLKAFGNPAGYPVIIRGIENGQKVERHMTVYSITRGLDAVADWPEVLRTITEDAVCIVSNTTEKGFAVPDDERVDLTNPAAHVPASYPGRLLASLAARFNAGEPGLTIFPTELISRNGDVLKAITLDLARRNGASPTLLAWLEEQCIFANSLVDRIVSEPIDPIGAVAEPYALWAVERVPGLVMPMTHEAIRVVDDLETYARLKIHILNLGHSFLAETWLQGGWADDTTVTQMLADPATRSKLMSVYNDEVLPGFTARGMGAEAADYIAATIQRFDNPFLEHRVRDIANGHSAKVTNRIGAFLEWTGTSAPALETITQKYPAK
jgi:tagaturonate reductase